MALRLQDTKDIIAMLAFALLIPTAIIGVTIHIFAHLDRLLSFEVAAYIALLLEVAAVYFGLTLPTSYYSVGLLLGGISALTGLGGGLYFPFANIVSLILALVLLVIVGHYLMNRK
jgi:hypothetical protein